MIEYSSALHDACLSFLNKEEASILLNAMDCLDVAAGATLFQTGDKADCTYILVSGRMAVQKPTGFGGRMQVVALLDAGAPIGEIGILDTEVRGATLVAVSDSHLLILSAHKFAEIISADPILSVKVLSWLMARLSLRLKKSSERLAHVL
jgi:CRP/FNR family transcriptional regulator, cyclic AMP receptor protein